MKKGRIRYGFLLLLLLLLALPTAAADLPGDSAADKVDAEYAALRDAIPPEVAALLPDSFFDGGLADAEDTLREGGGIKTVLRTVGRLSGLALSDSLALLAQLCGILLLCAVLRALCPGGERGSVGSAFSLCATLAMSVLLFSLQRDRFGQISAYFDTVRALSTAMLPLMGTLYAMGGNVRAAVVNHGIMSAFLSILEVFCASTVLPIAGVCLSLALLDAISGRINLRPLAGLIKRSYTLMISFLMLLLCGVLGVQSTLAKAGDTLALRTARFAAGSFLPVVGGSVSESLRTVAASVEYLRGVAGTGAILLLFFSFLPIFLSTVLTRIAFLLAGSAAKLLSCDTEERVLAEMASVYGYFLAVIASLFVMLTFSLTLFAHCASAG